MEDRKLRNEIRCMEDEISRGPKRKKEEKNFNESKNVCKVRRRQDEEK